MGGVKHGLTTVVKQHLIVFSHGITEHQAMLDTIGQRIKHIIDNSPLTQSDIAAQCGVTKQAITGWTNKSAITKQNLSKFCKITHTNMQWVLEKKGAMMIETAHHQIEEPVAPYNMDDVKLLDRINKLSHADRVRLAAIIDALNSTVDKSTGS